MDRQDGKTGGKPGVEKPGGKDPVSVQFSGNRTDTDFFADFSPHCKHSCCETSWETLPILLKTPGICLHALGFCCQGSETR